jgi:hypothetical protein
MRTDFADIKTCEFRESVSTAPMMMFPIYVGSVLNEDHYIKSETGTCFSAIYFSVKYLPSRLNYERIQLTVDPHGKKSFFCKDWFLISILGKWHTDTIFREKKHVVEFKNITPDDRLDVMAEGIRIF